MSGGSRRVTMTFLAVLLIVAVGTVSNVWMFRRYAESNRDWLSSASSMELLLMPSHIINTSWSHSSAIDNQTNGTVGVTPVQLSDAASLIPHHQPTVWIMLHGIKGRMGNYLMQYSAALGLATQIPATLCLSPRTMQKRRAIHSTFQGPFAPVCPNHLGSVGSQSYLIKDWVETNDTFDATLVQEARNCSESICVYRMVGFWSSHQYFDHIRPQLRDIWQLSTHSSSGSSSRTTRHHYRQLQHYMAPTPPRNESFATDNHDNNDNNSNNNSIIGNSTRDTTNVIYIGIHVRRGDIMTVDAYRVPDVHYYHRAMNYYRSKYSNSIVHFYVASDDKAWCRQQFNTTIPADAGAGTSDTEPSANRSSTEDTTMATATSVITVLPDKLVASVELAILAQCRHVITSVGTFGWWAAYLSGASNTSDDESMYPIHAYDPEYWTTTKLQHFLPSTWKGM